MNPPWKAATRRRAAMGNGCRGRVGAPPSRRCNKQEAHGGRERLLAEKRTRFHLESRLGHGPFKE